MPHAPCQKELKHRTALGMYECVRIGVSEYRDNLIKAIRKPGFDGTLRMYRPDTVSLDMEKLATLLEKKYVRPDVPTVPRIILAGTEDSDRMLANTPLKEGKISHMTKEQRRKLHISKKQYYQRQLPIIHSIRTAAENALLEFKYAVVDYIKQDGIQPGCLPTKERAVLWKVDAYYMNIITKMKQLEERAASYEKN